jgi:hypothetical protein
MKNIIDVLRSMPDFIGSNGRSKEEIELAETMLEVAFARDYRNYLEEIGLACFDGHELTGLTKTDRLNVVTVTMEQRERFGKIASTWYVIEEANIYGIVIWQDTEGFVYEAASNANVKKVADSLSEYFTR